MAARQRGTCLADVGRVSRHLRFSPIPLACALFCGAFALAGFTATATTSAFLTDDPLEREPETQDASGVQPWTIDLFIDLALNMFGEPGDKATAVRAGNVNTID